MNYQLIKYFIVILIISNNFVLSGQDNVTVVAQGLKTSKQKLQKLILERDIFVQKYVDSLNAYRNEGNCKLPNFFTQENFDQKFGSRFWLTTHSPVSLRKMIIDRIDNYDILWCVNDSQEPKVFIKDTTKVRCLYCKIPFDQFSFYDLVGFRLDELMNSKHSHIKN